MAETLAVETIVKILKQNFGSTPARPGIRTFDDACTSIANQIIKELPATSISSSNSHAVLIQEISSLKIRLTEMTAQRDSAIADLHGELE